MASSASPTGGPGASAIAWRAVDPTTMTYATEGRIARITLDRPERGNGITLELPRELAACVERANLDPEVHVIALAGNGSGFCGGYDLGFAEQLPATSSASPPGVRGDQPSGERPAASGAPTDPEVVAANHDPAQTLGSRGRLPDDEPQRARLHEPVLVREAGDLQGPRVLRGRRHGHGAVFRPARGRGSGEDRLSAGARLGCADDGAVGAPDRPGAGEAPVADRRLDRRRDRGRVGAGERVRSCGRARWRVRGAARARRAGCRSTSS